MSKKTIYATSPTLEGIVSQAKRFYCGNENIHLIESGDGWEVWNGENRLSTKVEKRNQKRSRGFNFYCPE